jgi:DNA-binding YbaB/EbfC family protein
MRAMFSQFGNIADMLKNAGKLRESAEKAAEELARTQVEGMSGGGTVTVKVSGKFEVVSVKIDPKLLADGDAELLEDLIVAAVNDGLVKAREAMAQSFMDMTGGLPAGLLSGLSGLNPGGGRP